MSFSLKKTVFTAFVLTGLIGVMGFQQASAQGPRVGSLVMKLLRGSSGNQKVQLLLENGTKVETVMETSLASNAELTATLEKMSKVGKISSIVVEGVASELTGGSNSSFHAVVSTAEEKALIEGLAGRLPRIRIKGYKSASGGPGQQFIPISSKFGSFNFISDVGYYLRIPIGVSKEELERTLLRFLNHPDAKEMIYITPQGETHYLKSILKGQ